MKCESIIRLYTPEEIDAHIRSGWQTDLFRDSHDRGGFIAQVVRSFGRLPCFFYDPSDEQIEKAHFSVWWRGIQNRSYDNPVIHDLYRLHEFFHGGDMVYQSGLNHESWKRKMTDNELGASVCSEIEAYFRIPNLRQASFSHPIFVDRFLEDPETQRLWETDPDYVLRELRLRRQNIMMGTLSADHPDRTEFWIKQFMHQNDCWANIWVHRYDEVESACVRLRQLTANGDPVSALDRHIDDWLLSKTVTPEGDIPFLDEAQAFSGIYWHFKAAFARDYAQRASPSQDFKAHGGSPDARP